MKNLLSLLLFFILTASANMQAKVYVNNGNFYLDFTDVNEGNRFFFSRFYNSVGRETGMLGYGWGTPFESSIISVGGLVMVEEVPGGGKSFYLPKEKEDLSKVVDQIIKAASKDERKFDSTYLAKLKLKLLEDESILIEFAKRYKVKSTPAAGTVFISRERPMEYVKKLSTGYLRLRNDGIKDEFNNEGKIARVTYVNGDSFRFIYGENSRLVEARYSDGKFMKFVYNERGLVTKIVLYNKRTCEYKYNGSGDLIESKDSAGLVYSYDYDAYHNLIQLIQPLDKTNNSPTKTIVKYDIGKDKVVYLKTSDGLETFYEYLQNEAKDDYYSGTKVIKKFNSSVDVEKYETWKRPRPDGSLYVYKVRETNNNDVKTAAYTMCCGTPLWIDLNGKTTKFEYDEKGRLKKKIFPEGRILDVRYNQKGFIERILNNGEPYVFKYDEHNRVNFAGMRKTKFKIAYDKKGRVSQIRDSALRSFGFMYDDSDRVIKLTSKEGNISINYDDKGNMVYAEKEDINDRLWQIRKAYQQYIEVIAVLALLDERF